MLTVVLVMNGLLAAFCFYIAWQVWQFRRSLIQATAALDTAEQATHAILHGAPDAILQGQIGTHQLRQNYRHLELQIRQAQKALALLRLGQSLLLRRTRLN